MTGTGEMKVCSLKAVCLPGEITELGTKAAGFFQCPQNVHVCVGFLSKKKKKKKNVCTEQPCDFR